jgi:putative transposase
MLSYTPVPDRDGAPREGLRQVACPGIGYRLARALLLPQFGVLNHKRVYRLWKQEQLSLKKRTTKKRRSGSKVPLAATHANQVWCLDFCHDACLNGTRLKVLAVKDEYTRECLALEVATGLDSQHLQPGEEDSTDLGGRARCTTVSALR